MRKPCTLLAVTLVSCLALGEDTSGDLWGELTPRTPIATPGASVSGLTLSNSICSQNEAGRSRLPGIVVRNTGGPDGYAARVQPVLFSGDFIIEGTVSAVKPGHPPGPGVFAGFEIDQIGAPNDPLVFLFIGARPTTDGFEVFAARDGNSNLGSITLYDTPEAHMRIAAEDNQIIMESRGCNDQTWHPLAVTSLDDFDRANALGAGGSNLGTGDALRVQFFRVEGNLQCTFDDLAGLSAAEYSSMHGAALSGAASLGGDPTGATAAPHFRQAEQHAASLRGMVANASEADAKERARLEKKLGKIEKSIRKAAEKAEQDKGVPAGKAALKAMQTAEKSADYLRSFFQENP
jgi:hypothetical protein